MLNKLKLRPATKQFEKKEGESRNPSVAEINALIEELNTHLATIPPAPYKMYWALLNQVGSSAPTATVLFNNTGKDITYSFISQGVYGVTVPGFNQAKTVMEVEPYGEDLAVTTASGGSAVDMKIVAYNAFSPAGGPQDDYLQNTPIKIYIFD